VYVCPILKCNSVVSSTRSVQDTNSIDYVHDVLQESLPGFNNY